MAVATTCRVQISWVKKHGTHACGFSADNVNVIEVANMYRRIGACRCSVERNLEQSGVRLLYAFVVRINQYVDVLTQAYPVERCSKSPVCVRHDDKLKSERPKPAKHRWHLAWDAFPQVVCRMIGAHL